jgi:integrase
VGVSVRQKNGEWFLFIRHTGERAAKKCKDQEEAESVAKAVRTAITLGQFDIAALKSARHTEEEKPTIVTLQEYYDKTLQPQWEASLSRSTSSGYDTGFRVHILPELGAFTLDKITRDVAKKFVVGLLTKSIGSGGKKKAESMEANAPSPSNAEGKPVPELRKLSKETIRNIVAALRGAFSEAVESGLLTINPAVRLGRFYKEAGSLHDEVDPFTAEEIQILLQTILTNHGFDAYVLMLCAFHTGLRAGELAGLEWGDLDFKLKTLYVRRQFTNGEFSKTKTRRSRKVDLSAVLQRELQELKRRRQTEYLEKGKNEIPDTIFLGPGILLKDGERTEGKPMDMDNFRNRVYWKACNTAKIRRRRFHDIRHTFASMLLSNGESPQYVSKQLGHASIRMTVDVYGHLIPGSNRSAMDRLPSLETILPAQSASG